MRGDSSSCSKARNSFHYEMDIDNEAPSGPLRSIMKAMLFDGIQSFMYYFLLASPKKKPYYREAVEWVNSKQNDYVFSFQNVCEMLGFNSDYLRSTLYSACAEKIESKNWVRGRRKF